MSNELQTIAQEVCTSQGWTLSKKIGEGSFKEVFEVTSGGERAALKIFKSCGSHDRTIREIDFMLKCSHDQIAKLLAVDVFEVAGAKYLYVIEEFMAGGSLSDKYAPGSMDLDDARTFINQIVPALDHLNTQHAVHRDIKPDNIMYRDPDGLPVMVDFGLVRLLGEASLRGYNVDVLVGFCFSEAILWGEAGASACATGKHGTLRKFNLSRWDSASKPGGSTIPQVFEEGLLTWLRPTDLTAVWAKYMSDSTKNNPYTTVIQRSIDKPEPYVGNGQRHYLWWFNDMATRLGSGTTTATSLIKSAGDNWEDFFDNGAHDMESDNNDGSWLNHWRKAIRRFNQPS